MQRLNASGKFQENLNTDYVINDGAGAIDLKTKTTLELYCLYRKYAARKFDALGSQMAGLRIMTSDERSNLEDQFNVILETIDELLITRLQEGK